MNARTIILSGAFLALSLTGTVMAQQLVLPPGFNDLAAAEAAANAKPGPRSTPARTMPVPTDEVSPEAQALIALPFPPHMVAAPADAAAWKDLITKRAALAGPVVAKIKEKLGVSVEPTTIAGVKAYIVTPKSMPDANRNRLLVHVHGGGYVFGPGEAALPEAILMAGHGRIKVISIDYLMPPDFPYPAAIDDAMAVYKEVLKTTDAKKIGIFGTSTGGGMTLAMVLRARSEGLPLPAAIAPGTPWADLTETGDS